MVFSSAFLGDQLCSVCGKLWPILSVAHGSADTLLVLEECCLVVFGVHVTLDWLPYCADMFSPLLLANSVQIASMMRTCIAKDEFERHEGCKCFSHCLVVV
ncbi:unnamed protein product, partial [Ilex paraguariensis]